MVWVRFFISQTSGDVIFFLCHALYNDARFFTGLYPTREIFSVQDFFSSGISLPDFFYPRNQSAGCVFLKSPIPQITTQQSNGQPLTDYDFSYIALSSTASWKWATNTESLLLAGVNVIRGINSFSLWPYR